MQGWLGKKYPLRFGNWKLRWCVLASSELVVYEDETCEEVKLRMPLQAGARAVAFSGEGCPGEGVNHYQDKPFGFAIEEREGRLYYFAARDAAALEAWCAAIRYQCNASLGTPGLPADRWVVEVDRSSDESLGVDLDNTSLKVISVDWKGLVGAWNSSTTDPEKVVTTGDRVVDVNGKRTADAIVAECKKKRPLRITLVRESSFFNTPLSSGQWMIELDRSSGESLGVEVDPGSLRIKYVCWKGLLGTWNIENPGQIVRRGDRILMINGKRDVQQILKECRKDIILRLVMERDLGPGEWRLDIDNSYGERLGLDIDSLTLAVKSVDWKGLVGAWNVHSVDAEKIVKPGDKIVEVNWQRGFAGIVEECSKLQPLKIVISPKKSLPKDYLAPGQWRIEIDRSSGDPLGVELEKDGLQLKSVSWKGLIGAWNVDNPDRCINRGDRIAEVNGKQDIPEILKECAKLLILRIVVIRDLAPGEWRLQVDRSSGEPLGVDMDCRSMTIKSVDWKGLIGAWNVDTEDQDKVVKTGDQIVEVNRQRGIDKIVEECAKLMPLQIVMLRTLERFQGSEDLRTKANRALRAAGQDGRLQHLDRLRAKARQDLHVAAQDGRLQNVGGSILPVC